jgi:2-polyprenyl-3-methyl-5-hydroxy-6-metoxy-1,4-benzoquinol methylase
LLEPGISGILNAKKRGLKKIICVNFNEIDLYPNSIPAIGIFDVLEHIEDDVEFLEKIQKCLIIGGRLYITVPTYSWLWSDEDNKAGHFRRYTINLLKSKIKQIGLEIEYSTYIFSILPAPIFLFRVLTCKLKLKQNESQKRTKNEHKKRKGLTGNILQKIWNSELKAISIQKSIPFGGSCLLVAKK